MSNANWPPTLEFFLQWTQTRIPNRQIMRRRLDLLLEMHRSCLPATLIKITGTNGKGSVCAMLEASLIADGHTVGLFTSPHLTRVTERIRINGQEISADQVENYALALRAMLEAWVERVGIEMLPSFFEILMLIALRAFHDAGIEVVIFEAGIGGSNDAVSVLPGQVAAITSVGLDHMAILGDTLEAIAIDKAGIASPDTPLVLGPTISQDLIEVIQARCSQDRITPIACQHTGLEIGEQTLAGIRFNWCGLPAGSAGFLNLSGKHQIQNLLVVLQLLTILQQQHVVRDLARACTGLNKVQWACRMSLIPGDPNWLLDVAHNAHAMQALIESLDTLLPYEQRILLYGTAQDKDYAAYLAQLPNLSPEIWLVDGFHRAASAHDLAQQLAPIVAQHPHTRICGKFDSLEDAIAMLNAAHCNSGKTVIVAGSVFLAGAALQSVDAPTT